MNKKCDACDFWINNSRIHQHDDSETVTQYRWTLLQFCPECGRPFNCEPEKVKEREEAKCAVCGASLGETSAKIGLCVLCADDFKEVKKPERKPIEPINYVKGGVIINSLVCSTSSVEEHIIKKVNEIIERMKEGK